MVVNTLAAGATSARSPRSKRHTMYHVAHDYAQDVDGIPCLSLMSYCLGT
jgi:hypothetical protein